MKISLLAILLSAITPAAAAVAQVSDLRSGADASPFKNLPAFCRVSAPLKTTSDGWNGYSAMAQAFEHGYATSSTDPRSPCPYPQVAKYKGTGSIDGEANFACELPSSAATND
jgi:hypothetical protein